MARVQQTLGTPQLAVEAAKGDFRGPNDTVPRGNKRDTTRVPEWPQLPRRALTGQMGSV